MICSQTVYDWSFNNKQWCKSLFFKHSVKQSYFNVVKVKFVINNIKNIVWNLFCFNNLTIFIMKKKVITALIKAHMFCVFDDVMNNFVVKKKQELITLLQYEIWHLILSHKLTFTFSDSFEVNKILTAEELFEYLEKSLYAVSSAFFHLFDHSDFANICWQIKSKLKDAWRATVY